MSAHWMHAKLLLVFMLLVYHVICGYFVRQFNGDKNQYTSKFYRFYNEVPTLLLIAIVLLVVIKP